VGVVAGKRAVMGASTTESAGGRFGKRGVADRRGPRTSDSERQKGGQMLIGRSDRAASESGSVPTGRPHWAARGRGGRVIGCERAPTGGDRM
jgi:hypothetical protein